MHVQPEIDNMRISKRQLRKIIREETRLQESFVGSIFDRVKEVASDMIDPQGWMISGAGMGIDEQKLRSMATEDAWKLFKAMGGLGTDESTVREVLKRRAGDLEALHAEYDELRKSLVKQRGKFSTWVVQLMFAEKGKRLEGAGINLIMKKMQDRDLVGWLESDGLDEEADMVSAALSSDPVDKLIAYIQTVTPDDEIGLSEVEEMLRNQGHSAEKIDSILEDPRLDQYYDALEDIFAPGRVQNENRVKITKRQLRRIIKEVMDKGPDFPDLSHPTIAQFANKTYGPSAPMGGTKWFTSMMTYRYKAGGSSEQSITVYHLPDGQYRARIGGSYNNTLSSDRRSGVHPDAISAIEAALDSSPSSSGPTARELLTRVGEKVKSDGYIGQD